MLEIPGDNAVEFPLPILAALDGGPMHVGRHVPVQPLLPEHRKECGEERDGEGGVQQSLSLNDGAWRAGPLWNPRCFVTESGVVDLVDEDTEESGSFFVWVRLEPGVDLDNEGGSNCREQTSLCSESILAHPSNSQDSRISTSCSNPRHISCRILCRTPQPLDGNPRKIWNANPPESDARLASDCGRGFSDIQGGMKRTLTHLPASCFPPPPPLSKDPCCDQVLAKHDATDKI